jgi:hypothetical protein
MMVRVMRLGIAVCAFSAAIAISPAAAESAVLDAPPDRVREAAVASLQEEGFRISTSIRRSSDLTARRSRTVKYENGVSDAAAELQRIAKVDPMWEADVNTLSEYHVTMTVVTHPVESGETRIDVNAQITGARRTRGRRGRPLPVPIQSNGALEKQLVGDIQNRLASTGDSSSQPHH